MKWFHLVANTQYRLSKSENKIHLRACIAIQQSLRLHDLPPVLTPFALECLMSFAKGIFVEQEQLPEGIYREVPFRVFFLIYNSGRECLLVGLPLEDLLFNRPRRYESVHKTYGMMHIGNGKVNEDRCHPHIPSSARHARHEPRPVGQRRDSNL